VIDSALTICPIFAILLVGFLSGRFSLLGASAGTEFNRYLVRLALPALLFEVMAGSKWSELWRPDFFAVFFLGSFVVFGATVAVRFVKGSHLADATIDGLNAGYANVGFVGLPLCDAVFGRQCIALATIAVILTVCVLFGIALVLLELGLQDEGRTSEVIAKVGMALLKNPLLVAPLAGAAWSLLGIPIPTPIEAFVHMLSASATPCALMALGLFLAVKRQPPVRPGATAFMLTALKLGGQPIITAIIGFYAFHLRAETAGVAVLMAALPTGTGPFMLAEFYDREAITTSHTVLISTSVSIATLAGIIFFLR